MAAFTPISSSNSKSFAMEEAVDVSMATRQIPAPSVCTIASSVSNLAVTEGRLVPGPSVPAPLSENCAPGVSDCVVPVESAFSGDTDSGAPVSSTFSGDSDGPVSSTFSGDSGGFTLRGIEDVVSDVNHRINSVAGCEDVGSDSSHDQWLCPRKRKCTPENVKEREQQFGVSESLPVSDTATKSAGTGTSCAQLKGEGLPGRLNIEDCTSVSGQSEFSLDPPPSAIHSQWEATSKSENNMSLNWRTQSGSHREAKVVQIHSDSNFVTHAGQSTGNSVHRDNDSGRNLPEDLDGKLVCCKERGLVDEDGGKDAWKEWGCEGAEGGSEDAWNFWGCEGAEGGCDDEPGQLLEHHHHQTASVTDSGDASSCMASRSVRLSCSEEWNMNASGGSNSESSPHANQASETVRSAPDESVNPRADSHNGSDSFPSSRGLKKDADLSPSYVATPPNCSRSFAFKTRNVFRDSTVASPIVAESKFKISDPFAASRSVAHNSDARLGPSTSAVSADCETDSSGSLESFSDTTSSSESCGEDDDFDAVDSVRLAMLRDVPGAVSDCIFPDLGGKLCRRKKKKAQRHGLNSDAVIVKQWRPQSGCMRIKPLGRANGQDAEAGGGSTKLETWTPHGSEEVAVPTATIDDLPYTLLVHVFSFLPVISRVTVVSLVCKKWLSAVVDPSLWRRLDLRNLPRLNDSSLVYLTSLSDRVTSLIVSDGLPTMVTDQGVSRALQQCPRLKKAKFNRCFFLSDEGLKCVGLYCHNLTCLNISGCFTVTDETLLAISEGCPQLLDLDLGQCGKVTDEGVQAVAKGCPLLTRFRLDQCCRPTNDSIETIADSCANLQNLHLLSCSLTDVGIIHIAKLSKLQVLDISNVSQLGPRTLQLLAMHCRGLETLALSLNRAVDDECLLQLGTHCPRLRCLSCVACGISDVGLGHLARHAANLERLDVAWCTNITDAGVSQVSARCPKLCYFGIMRCVQITMATLEKLLICHPHIQYSNFELDSRRLLGRAAQAGYRTDAACRGGSEQAHGHR